MTECPTCGRGGFSSRQYMRSHHKQVHGESLAGFEYTCHWCEHSGVKSQIDDYDEHQFCSTECFHEWRSDTLVGENSPVWEGRTVVVDCDWCGDATEKAMVRMEKNERAFCSMDCHGEWLSENWSGEDHPHWSGGGQSVDCQRCGETFKRTRTKIDRNEHNFCSTQCYGGWISENNTGESHPRWKGGCSITYGPNWQEKRQERLERDGHECVVCGMSNAEHEVSHGVGLHVHHINPASDYLIDGNTIDHEKANRLENLITLCTKCHRRWEGIPLRPGVQQ